MFLPPIISRVEASSTSSSLTPPLDYVAKHHPTRLTQHYSYSAPPTGRCWGPAVRAADVQITCVHPLSPAPPPNLSFSLPLSPFLLSRDRDRDRSLSRSHTPQILEDRGREGQGECTATSTLFNTLFWACATSNALCHHPHAQCHHPHAPCSALSLMIMVK